MCSDVCVVDTARGQIRVDGGPQCASGQFCDPLEDCQKGAVCAADGDCADTDPCTTQERCNPTSRTCEYGRLDGDRDGFIPVVCGGNDCDDDDSAIPSVEEADDQDDDCDGRVDEGAL